MIPELCPLSSRSRLRVVLRGEHDCVGHKEKNDKGVYNVCEACMGCSFYQPENLFDWGGVFTQPNPSVIQPQVILPYTPGTGTYTTTTTPNTGGGSWYTYTKGSQPYGVGTSYTARYGVNKTGTSATDNWFYTTT